MQLQKATVITQSLTALKGVISEEIVKKWQTVILILKLKTVIKKMGKKGHATFHRKVKQR
jgi:hypothetical protein